LPTIRNGSSPRPPARCLPRRQGEVAVPSSSSSRSSRRLRAERVSDTAQAFANQPFHLGHSLMIRRERLKIPASGLKQGGLGIQATEEAKLPLAIAFADGVEGTLRTGQHLLVQTRGLDKRA